MHLLQAGIIGMHTNNGAIAYKLSPFFMSFVVMHGPGDPRAGKSRRFGLLPSPALCPTPQPSCSVFCQHGGHRPKVFHDGSRCGECVFLMDCDCLWVAQLILAVEHTRDRSGRPLPVCCRHREKKLESISRTSNSRNSLHYRIPHTENHSETAPSA